MAALEEMISTQIDFTQATDAPANLSPTILPDPDSVPGGASH